MIYLVDTNIFIKAHNEMPMDVWQTLWIRLSEAANHHIMYSISKVREEIERGHDELPEWFKLNVPSDFFIDLDVDIIHKYTDVQNWAAGQPHYKTSAREDFAQVADAYLIATAKSKGWTIVTYEKPDPNNRKRVKIPDACNGLGVRYCDFNTFLRENNIFI